MSAETRLQELNLELPAAPKPIGVYRPILIHNELAYLSGHLPMQPDNSMMTGRVGDEVDTAYGYKAARQVGLTMLATLRNALGSLDRVQQTIKLFGVVNCVPGFTDQPSVVNGCSELLIEVFGEERGVGARSAIGTPSLPANVSVEIEAVFQISAN